jgi:hypothetical protein
MVFFDINGFKNINFVKYNTSSYTSELYIDENKKYFIKKPRNFIDYDILKREIFIYNLLESKGIKWMPKLLYHDNNLLIMEYYGEQINSENIPDNYEEQIEIIKNDLNKLKIKHNDIFTKKKNIIKIELLVKNNIIYLCDFGWCSIDNDFSCGRNISKKNKPHGIFNNFTDLLDELKKMHYKKKKNI